MSKSSLRTKLIEYSRQLPSVPTLYTVKYYQGKYFNLDLDKIHINANNDAAALVVLYDYLNQNLVTPVKIDHYEEVNMLYETLEALGDDWIMKEVVNNAFDNDTLWLSKETKEPMEFIELAMGTNDELITDVQLSLPMMASHPGQEAV